MFYECFSLETVNSDTMNMSSAKDVSYMYAYCYKVNCTLNMRGNPTEYTFMFSSASTSSGSKIVVNYLKENESLVDSLIATKTPSSNVVKGVVL